MWDLAAEMARLAEAEHHITQGDLEIAARRSRIEQRRQLGDNVQNAEAILAKLERTLQTWHRYRAGILRNIALLEAALPSQSNMDDQLTTKPESAEERVVWLRRRVS